MLRHYKTRVCAQNIPKPITSHINRNSQPYNPPIPQKTLVSCYTNTVILIVLVSFLDDRLVSEACYIP